MKKLIAVVLAVTTNSWAQDVQVETMSEHLGLKQRLELTALEEFVDEFRPFDIEVEMAEMDATWNPHWTDSVRWEKVEEEAADHFLDATRHTAEEMITESEWFQKWADKFEDKLDLRIRKRYRREDQGEFGSKEFTLDISTNVAKATHNNQRLWFDAGISLDHIQDPTMFVTWRLAHRGKAPYLSGLLELEPVDQQVDLRITDLPWNLDFRAKYDIDDEVLSVNFLGIPLTRERPQGVRFFLGAEHSFEEEETFLTVRAAGGADKLFGWLFNAPPRKNF